jgi:hypothetical protein
MCLVELFVAVRPLVSTRQLLGLSLDETVPTAPKLGNLLHLKNYAESQRYW